jgi:hypothetical protein
MHLLKYNPEAKTLTEVPPSEFDADPTCRYFYVLGKRAHVPIVTPDGIGEIVWEHPPGLEVCSCLIELRDRIEALEAAQHAHAITGPTNQLHSYKVGPAEPVEDWGKGFTQVRTPDPAAGAQVGRSSAAVNQVLALQDQIRDGSLTLSEALKKINGDDQPVQQFIAKYLFTDGNIQQDRFCYDPSDSNSVSFDIANLDHGCLKPGDNIKIAHRWGELPASDVYSTINYKVVSVSETENRAWTIRAVRVDTSDSEPAPTADAQPTLVDRVANALYSVPEPAGGVRSLAAYSVALPAAEARAAIREVAEWLRSEYPQREGFGTTWANLLDNEANCHA